jgi:amino acid adenylation domain-containing protein
MRAELVRFERRHTKVTNLKPTPPLPAELAPGMFISELQEAGADLARAWRGSAGIGCRVPQAAGQYLGMNTLLQHGVTAQAQAQPEAVALVFNGTRLTYGALEEASNRLAHLLADAGVRRGDRVALMMPKLPTAIVAMLGVLKADAVYVPMDPASPAARQARVLEVSDCRGILAAGSVGEKLRETLTAATLQQQPMIGWLDEDIPPEDDPAPAFSLRDLAGYSTGSPSYANSDSDLAHILFTSGSTGVPKGVMITHANVVHFLRWAGAYFGITSSDRISQHPPLRFDVSTFDIFGTLWAGAELHLVPPELNLLPHKLAQFIRDARLTQWFSVPSVLNLMTKFDVVDWEDFSDLRRVMWCGEVLPTPTLIHWMRRLPHVQFTNLYGPTETTIASSYYTVPRCPTNEQESVPIGTACDGEELLLFNKQMNRVAPGEVGDLYIRGTGLSPGYWRDPEKTRSVFVPRPGGAEPHDRIYKTGDLARRGAGGLFYFVGRADTQIKSRGYRIELGEIETALHLLPGLQESAVVAIQSEGFEGWLICCAYVPAPDNGVSIEGLRMRLAALLPGYMLPARWMHYDILPKNDSGKIDRALLKNTFLRAEARHAQAQTPPSENAGTADLMVGPAGAPI